MDDKALVSLVFTASVLRTVRVLKLVSRLLSALAALAESVLEPRVIQKAAKNQSIMYNNENHVELCVEFDDPFITLGMVLL